ncbi:NUDIX hydrolase [Salirhabdus sp. Marseille-P4669]|uniref:NUDIX hydrolase n=1 Tax=Salirhabdus sp. Marseille-P4669 TaxID=2042310 RepID=UPI000C7DCBB9|nr:CoA pyrophosphatase [Salirhabdus sp. Marseille-P4669]
MDSGLILRKLQNHHPFILGHEHFLKSSVLLPLIEKNGEVHVLFEVRSQQLRRQPGEICFPGGRIESQDASEMDAAIRETTEELGIGYDHISNVYPIDYMVTPFGMIVYPYVGWIRDEALIKPNTAEVDHVFTVPLSFFMNHKPDIYKVNVRVQPEEDFPFELIQGGKDYNWRTSKVEEHFYLYEDKVIWGLTARILMHFINLLKKEE